MSKKVMIAGTLGHAAISLDPVLTLIMAVAYTSAGAAKIAAALTAEKGWVQPVGANKEGHFDFVSVPRDEDQARARYRDAVLVVSELDF